MQGAFKEAVILHYAEPAAGDRARPQAAAVRVMISRECSGGESLRLRLPPGAVQDLSGAVAAAPLVVESPCMQPPLVSLSVAVSYMRVLGAAVGAVVAAGAAMAMWLWWRSHRLRVGQSMPAASVALGTLALLLQGAKRRAVLHTSALIRTVQMAAQSMFSEEAGSGVDWSHSRPSPPRSWYTSRASHRVLFVCRSAQVHVQGSASRYTAYPCSVRALDATLGVWEVCSGCLRGR
jgi:hypothetical protein